MQTQSNQERKSTADCPSTGSPSIRLSCELSGAHSPKAMPFRTALMNRILCFIFRSASMKTIARQRHTSSSRMEAAACTGHPYIERVTLLRSRSFGVYVQRVVGAPEVQFHDHPWHMVSMVLAGGYVERVLAPGLVEHERRINWFNRHTPSSFHTLVSASKGTWMLVLTRQKLKPRGFLDTIQDGQAEYVVPSPTSCKPGEKPKQLIV